MSVSRARTRARRTAGALLAAAGLLGGGAVALAPAGTAATTVHTAPSTRAATSPSAKAWVHTERTCRPPEVGYYSCDALRLVRTSTRTPGSVRAAAVAAGVPRGPAGGYTPEDLITAYDVPTNTTAGAGQLVAVVDAYADPNIRADLNTFDHQYGRPAETDDSFRIVNQRGGTTLPAPDTSGWTTEQALDVEAVRAVCPNCDILLVEADSGKDADLDTAENTAAALGATEITNSFGRPEAHDPATPSEQAAFDHPGIVITASAGDDGWYDWDNVNSPTGHSGNSPELPAAYPTVVGVGGTHLDLAADGTRAAETVWNDNGPSDNTGYAAQQPLGAGGGGCSSVEQAPPWQLALPGYATLGCTNGGRSAVDIAADADPATGLDIYSSYDYSGTQKDVGWLTYGGTSLAAPLVAGMWAAAGGASGDGVPYPALMLYANFASGRGVYDVTSGGNGACGTAATATCAAAFAGGSPNKYVPGDVIDCAFAPTGTAVLANHSQCYARHGFDGPTGVGTPSGPGVFQPAGLSVSETSPSRVVAGTPVTFDGTGSSDPVPGGSVLGYAWTWGDSSDRSHGATATHTWATPGTYSARLSVVDSYGIRTVLPFTVTVTAP